MTKKIYTNYNTNKTPKIKNAVPTASQSHNKAKTKGTTSKDYKNMSDLQKLEYELEQYNESKRALKTTARTKGYSSKALNKIINKDLEKYEPTVTALKNTRYHGKDVISIRIDQDKYSTNNRKFTIKNIQKISDSLSKELKENNINGNIMTSLRYGNLNWKSGYMREIGDEVKMYDPNELYNLDTPYQIPDSIPAFNIYVALGDRNRAQGGNDEYNDCLYTCLKYYVFNIEDYFKSPSELKAFLKLRRCDKIPLYCVDIIEKKLKDYKINIRGDYIRTSTINSNKEINLLLINEHYSVEKIKRKLLNPLNIKYEEKTIILYDKRTLEAYNGNRKWTLTKQERGDLYYNAKSAYILVDRYNLIDFGKDEEGNQIKKSIEEEYEQYIIICDTIKKESKGLINLYKCSNYNGGALNLFDKLSKFVNPEPILQDEAIWIKLSTYKAIISCIPYEGQLYKYDFKSFYPHLMTVSTNRIPIKRGEFKTITDFHKDYFEYGIYRCVIEKSEDERINNIFSFNYHNYYTNLDLESAKKLNLKISLIQDDKPNFLYYSRDKLMTMSQLFDNYINILFPLKENLNIDKVIRNSIKTVLTRLWGCLCEVDKIKYYIDNEKFSIDEDEEILEIYPSHTDDKAHIIKTTKINAYYKTDFARIAPFIISYGRRQMTNTMYNYKDNIYRVQTDGFFINTPIHFNKDVKLGELKYEGFTENGNILNKINNVKVHY